MTLKTAFTLIAAVVLTTVNAKAEGIFTPPPQIEEAVTPAPAIYRTGCYIHGSAGVGITQADSAGVTFADHGVAWGLGGGCDLVTGSLLIGALGNVDWTEIGGSFEPAYQVGLRGGVLISPHVLAYATGGWTLADFGSDFDGYFIGGGAEILINRHLFAGLEYTASIYNDEAGVDPMTHAVKVRAGWRF